MIDRPNRRRIVPVLGVLILAAATLGSMSWTEPPRYDGAGYATLGRSLATGRGYREIHDPAAPPHAHFPPAYPGLLAAAWAVVGTDRPDRFTAVAHGLSLAAVLAGLWGFARWWRATEPAAAAAALSLALAANWTWARAGGVIRSEPLAIALGAATLLLARRPGRGIVLGVVLGLGLLTRQVFACWALAVAVDLGLRRGWLAAGRLLAVVAAVVAPWLAWQVRVGSGAQAGLFRREGLAPLVASQALFYARRIPDAVVGPVVEVATVFARAPRVGQVATLGAILATALVLAGWVRMLWSPRRRLGALIPLATLPLLLAWPFTEAGRFLVPLVPFVLMGAVDGLSLLLGLRLDDRRSRRLAGWLVLAAALPYPTYALVAHRPEAERRTHRDFDAACAFVASRPAPAGPVMARHPADVAWLTGRPAVAIPPGGPLAIRTAIRRDGVAFLVVDADRYANSPDNPLARLVAEPGFARRVRGDGRATTVYQIDPAPAPPPAEPGRNPSAP